MKQKNKTKNTVKQLNLHSFFGKTTTNPNARLDTETHVNKEVMKEIISLVEKNIANESKLYTFRALPRHFGKMTF